VNHDGLGVGQAATQTLQVFRGKLCRHIDLIMPALPTIELLILREEQENASDAFWAASYIAEIGSPSEFLQQLEFKSNRIAHFYWQEVAAHLQSLIAITFEKNDFLKAVDEDKAVHKVTNQ
jgi:hypothetical protein